MKAGGASHAFRAAPCSGSCLHYPFHITPPVRVVAAACPSGQTGPLYGLQLSLRYTQMFPGQLGDGLAWVRWMCPGELTRRHPYSIPRPPQLIGLYPKEQRLYFEEPVNLRPPRPVAGLCWGPYAYRLFWRDVNCNFHPPPGVKK